MKAVRIHQAERIKAKRKGNHNASPSAVHTPAACSCFMCGNPRKFFNEPTVQERRFMQDLS